MAEHLPYTAPSADGAAFNCPFCYAYSNQLWNQATWSHPQQGGSDNTGFRVAKCTRCEKFSVWLDECLIYPTLRAAPPPNPDLPDEIKADYEEARAIAAESPRGAAALLRLAIQKVCVLLGEPGKNLSTDIGSLVKKGLYPRVQQSLDIVRVIGNEAVHPGTIDLRDDAKTANSLFALVNIIADWMISQPKQVEELYRDLPQPQLEQIERRDQGASQ